MMYEFFEKDENSRVRTGDLAEKLGVSPASATEMAALPVDTIILAAKTVKVFPQIPKREVVYPEERHKRGI